ncbi:hypothetical protein BAU15_12160 [Enterococcus sp. JM4C]|uniref:YczE/YyaS/YitT family protein n=1 Tax=Candidatus Enterococcus huntleyi TaxID=1857217 RepID=UPI00137AF67F|nr:YitT family protein [Enterococcus sp. JM4C]KAF1296032.1 hypothetical protein BAU15_12160 [Enterococcus sp. JM4C]
MNEVAGLSVKTIGIRSFYALLGVFILGLGAALLRISSVGLDPFTAANIGVGGKLGLSLGVYQLSLNALILVLVFLFGRKYIGIGTVINMVLTGFFIDFFTWLFTSVLHVPITSVSRIILLIFGVLIFTFGASFYMSAKLGNAPYDAIAPILVDRFGVHYRIIRIIQDVLFMLIAFLFGGPVGLATIINAFFTGPLITFWDEKVSQPLIEKSVKKLSDEN